VRPDCERQVLERGIGQLDLNRAGDGGRLRGQKGAVGVALLERLGVDEVELAVELGVRANR